MQAPPQPPSQALLQAPPQPPSQALLQAPPQPPSRTSSQALVENMNPEILKIMLEIQFMKDCENDLTFIFVLILLIYFLEDPKHSKFLSSYNYNNDFPLFEEISFITASTPLTIETGCIVYKVENDYIVLSTNGKFLRVTPDNIIQKLNSYNLDLTKYKNSLLNVLYLLFIKYVSNKTKQKIDVNTVPPQVIFDMFDMNTKQHILETEESVLKSEQHNLKTKKSVVKEMLKILKKMIYNFKQACPEFDVAELDKKLNFNLHASIQNALNITKNLNVKFSNTINPVEQDFKFLPPPFTVMLNYIDESSGTIDLIDIVCKIYEMNIINLVKDLNKIKSFFNTRFFIYLKSVNPKEINQLANRLGIEVKAVKAVKANGGNKTRKFKMRKQKTHKFKEYKPKTRKFKPKTRKMQKGGNPIIFLLNLLILTALFAKIAAYTTSVLNIPQNKASLKRLSEGGLYFSARYLAEVTGEDYSNIMAGNVRTSFNVLYNNRVQQFNLLGNGYHVTYENNGGALAFLNLNEPNNNEFMDAHYDPIIDYDPDWYHPEEQIYNNQLTPSTNYGVTPRALQQSSSNGIVVQNNILGVPLSDLSLYLSMLENLQKSNNLNDFVVTSTTQLVTGKAAQYIVTQTATTLASTATFYYPAFASTVGTAIGTVSATIAPYVPAIQVAYIGYQVYSLVTYDPIAEEKYKQSLIKIQNRIDEYKSQNQYNDILTKMVSDDNFITALANSDNMLGDTYFWGGVNFKNAFQFHPIYSKLVNKILRYMKEADDKNNIAELDYWTIKINSLNKRFEDSLNDLGKFDGNENFKLSSEKDWLKKYLDPNDKDGKIVDLDTVVSNTLNYHNNVFYKDTNMFPTNVLANTPNGQQIYQATPNEVRLSNSKSNTASLISKRDEFYLRAIKNDNDKPEIYYDKPNTDDFTRHLKGLSINDFDSYNQRHYDGNGNLLQSQIEFRDTDVRKTKEFLVEEIIKKQGTGIFLADLFFSKAVKIAATSLTLAFEHSEIPSAMVELQNTIQPKDRDVNFYFSTDPYKADKLQLYLNKVKLWRQQMFPLNEQEIIKKVLEDTPSDTNIQNMDDVVRITEGLIGTTIGTTNFPAKVKGPPEQIVSKMRAMILITYKNKLRSELPILAQTFLTYTNNMPPSFNTDYENAWTRLENIRFEKAEAKAKAKYNKEKAEAEAKAKAVAEAEAKYNKERAEAKYNKERAEAKLIFDNTKKENIKKAKTNENEAKNELEDAQNKLEEAKNKLEEGTNYASILSDIVTKKRKITPDYSDSNVNLGNVPFPHSISSSPFPSSSPSPSSSFFPSLKQTVPHPTSSFFLTNNVVSNVSSSEEIKLTVDEITSNYIFNFDNTSWEVLALGFCMIVGVGGFLVLNNDYNIENEQQQQLQPQQLQQQQLQPQLQLQPQQQQPQQQQPQQQLQQQQQQQQQKQLQQQKQKQKELELEKDLENEHRYHGR